MTKDLYIFHPQNNFNITGQDVGDVTGDVFFTRIDILTRQNTSVDHDYEWITYWQIDLVPRWGSTRTAMATCRSALAPRTTT